MRRTSGGWLDGHRQRSVPSADGCLQRAQQLPAAAASVGAAALATAAATAPASTLAAPTALPSRRSPRRTRDAAAPACGATAFAASPSATAATAIGSAPVATAFGAAAFAHAIASNTAPLAATLSPSTSAALLPARGAGWHATAPATTAGIAPAIASSA